MWKFVAVIAIAIIAILIFVSWYRSPKQKGKRGEREVARVLKKFGTVFNDYIIVDQHGKSHQVDHILVSHSGIFVLETKNLSGRIYGRQEQRNWTQVLAYGKVKNSIYNPLMQNKTHIYHVGRVIKNKYPITSCVVFVNADIRRVSADNVFTPRQLRSHLRKAPSVLTVAEILSIAETLQNAKNTTVSDKDHIKNVNETISAVSRDICPRCGGNLVIRNSKYGKFQGCSNYPKCTFKKSI